MPQQQQAERAERLRGAADEAARLAHGSYLSFLLLGTYIAIIIGSTTDVQLLKSSPVTLPLLNVSLPIVGFYIVAPWLLLLVYFNLLLQLTLLAQKLHRFNAVLVTFTDEAAREDQRARLFPFPFSDMLIGRPAPWRLRGLLGLMIGTTVVLLPLGLLLWAQVRFLPYHAEALTWNHRAAVLADLALLWLFWPLMLSQALRRGVAGQDVPGGQQGPHQRMEQRAVRTRRLWGAGVSCLTLVTVVFSLGIAVLPEEDMEGWMVALASHVPGGLAPLDPHHSEKRLFTLTVWLFEVPGAPFHRNLWLQEQVLVAGEPSAKVIEALRSEDAAKRAEALDEIGGLMLTNRDLRGADLRDAIFVKADLRGANLKGARLVWARVFAGNLSPFLLSKGERCIDTAQVSTAASVCRTNLQGAALVGAQLQGANLEHAQLQGANLEHAQLQGANLEHARLQGAALRFARLQGAALRFARLQGANLGFAQLQGANLGFAQLQGADLGFAQLQGADLEGAQLQGANLEGAQLQGAALVGAQLQGAALVGARLQGAALQNARIGSADFGKANLTWSDLRAISQSPLDEETYGNLEKILSDALSDKSQREALLARLRAAVRRPTNLEAAHADDTSVLCGDIALSSFCLSRAQITKYADGRAMFLGRLGCKDAALARRVAFFHIHLPKIDQEIAIVTAFAKHVTALPEKDCPGWAALSADDKESLRQLAAGEKSAP